MRVGFGWRIWIGVGRRLLPDLRVFPAVVGEDRAGVWRLVSGDRVRQRFDDRRRSTVVGVAQEAGPGRPPAGDTSRGPHRAPARLTPGCCHRSRDQPPPHCVACETSPRTPRAPRLPADPPAEPPQSGS